MQFDTASRNAGRRYRAARLRDTAYGMFNLSGFYAMLTAMLIAGLLRDVFGPGATFAAGAGRTGYVAVLGR